MKIFLQIFLAVGCVSVASAQAPIRQGSYELGTFVGSSYNVSEGAIMGGANISYAATKIFLPYVEYSYFPSIQRTATGNVGSTNFTFSASYPTHAIDYHVGVHIRFQIRESRFAPYGAFGIGGLGVGAGTINGYLATDAASPNTPVPFFCAGSLNVPGCPALGHFVAGNTGLAVNFGGGVRYYVTPRYGFRIEVKGYKPVSNQEPANTAFTSVKVTNTFLKAEAGFFIQFH